MGFPGVNPLFVTPREIRSHAAEPVEREIGDAKGTVKSNVKHREVQP
jgi:hypothetical protein